MLARWGAPISRQNLSDWVGAATALLEPLVKRMKHELLASGYVAVDETPIRCNDPDLRDGKTTQGWLWALSRPGGDAVFEWRLSRRHEEAERLLGDYQGVLQSDGVLTLRCNPQGFLCSEKATGRHFRRRTTLPTQPIKYKNHRDSGRYPR